jgi:hypothetical protein
MEGGRAWGVALAFWSNANIAVQNAAVSSATFFMGNDVICFHSEFHVGIWGYSYVLLRELPREVLETGQVILETDLAACRRR